MGRKSRDKGARGEREAAEALREIFPEARRRAMQARGGAEGADIDCTPGLHFEVGIGGVNPRTKWEQAERDAGYNVVPIALTRKDAGEWLVTMALADWLLAQDAIRLALERRG